MEEDQQARAWGSRYDGFHRFRALAGYDAYAQLLPAVSILLRPQISLSLLEM